MPGRTTTRGYGWTHQKRRAALLRRHIDGTPCPCDPTECGPSCPCRPTPQPMFKDPALNWDGLPLDADHTVAVSLGGTQADRLLLATCNRSRGNGTRTTTARFRATVTTRDW